MWGTYNAFLKGPSTEHDGLTVPDEYVYPEGEYGVSEGVKEEVPYRGDQVSDVLDAILAQRDITILHTRMLFNHTLGQAYARPRFDHVSHDFHPKLGLSQAKSPPAC